MISMRKALAGPAHFWQWFPAKQPNTQTFQERVRSPWGQWVRENNGHVHEWIQTAQGVGALSSWSSAREARDAWEAWVQTEAWRNVAPRLEQQCVAALLSQQDVSWDHHSSFPEVFVMWTRDASVKTREDRSTKVRPNQHLATREELPKLCDGATCWPLIGHPGRLFVRMPRTKQDSVCKALEETWGPAVEAPVVWSLERWEM